MVSHIFLETVVYKSTIKYFNGLMIVILQFVILMVQSYQ